MGLRHVAAATILALARSTLVAGPAQAHHAPRDGDHGPVSIDTTVPAGGSSQVTGPALGNAKQIKVTVKPQSGANATQDDIYDQFVNTIGTLSKGKRLLVCIMLHTTKKAKRPLSVKCRVKGHKTVYTVRSTKEGPDRVPSSGSSP